MYYRPVAVPVNVFVVQNNNSPAPLVAQGTTAYASNGGYQAAVLPLFDPNAYLREAQALLFASNESQRIASLRADELAKTFVALQAPAVERVVAGQAASAVLNAAGLNPRAPNAESSAYVLSRSTKGVLTVKPLSPERAEQITERARPNIPPQHYTAVQTFCIRCHADPNGKGGVNLNDARSLKTNWFDVTETIIQGKMPPESEKQPNDDERREIITGLQNMINGS